MRRRSLYALTGVLAQGAFRLITNVVIGRVAGAAVLGQTAGLLAAAQLMTLLGPTSLAAAQTRYVARAATDEALGEGFAVGVIRHVRFWALIVTTTVCVIAGGIWGLMLDASPTAVVILIALAAGLSAYVLGKSHLLATGQVKRLAIAELGTAGLGLVAMAALAATGTRDVKLLAPVAFTAWICAAITWAPARSGRLNLAQRREINAFVRVGVVGTLVSAGFLQASVLIASHVLPRLEAGIYAAAFALATPVSLITTSLGMVLFPAFARSLTAQETRALLRRALGSMLVVIVPPLCMLMLFAPELAAIVWGPQFAESAETLPVMLCAIGMGGAGLAGSQALTASGLGGMRTSMRIGILGAVTGMVVWLVSVPLLGAQGIALGYAIGTALTSCLPLFYMGRQVQMRTSRAVVMGWVAPALVAAVSVALVSNDVNLLPRGALALGLAGWWGVVVLRTRRQLVSARERDAV